MKKLIHENTEAIRQLNEVASELVNSLNMVLNRFTEKHNHFNQPVNEGFAFQLAGDPLGTFDELLQANSPIKPIAGKQQDIEKLAELTGIDREGFIQDFTICLPGSRDKYNKQGANALFRLQGKYKELVTWANDSFTLNKKELENQCEAFRIYAETPEQLAELEKWETLCNVLNGHSSRVKLDSIDSNRLADILKISYQHGKFTPKYEALARQIKSMALVD